MCANQNKKTTAPKQLFISLTSASSQAPATTAQCRCISMQINHNCKLSNNFVTIISSRAKKCYLSYQTCLYTGVIVRTKNKNPLMSGNDLKHLEICEICANLEKIRYRIIEKRINLLLFRQFAKPFFRTTENLLW